MPGSQPEWLTDGWESLEGGVDMGLPPSRIEPNQTAFATNATGRGGWLTHRPGMRFIGRVQAPGIFQGCGSYVGLDRVPMLFFSVAGNMHRMRIDNGEVTLDMASGNHPKLRKAWFCQAEEFLIVQDNSSKPLIYDGAAFRRAAKDEVPVGGPTTYGIGRVWVARGRKYVGGDLVDSDPVLGSASILKFTENTFIAEGGEFVVPWQSGDITGLTFASKPHTATGDAGLIITAENGFFEFAAPVDRTTWKDLEQPIQRFALLHNGSTSHESLVIVNGDIWFRGIDGVRSFVWAERDFQNWGNTPQSAELNPVVTLDERDLLGWCSGVLFDNRLLMTISPRLRMHGTEHDGLIAIDFDPISGMRRTVAPAWDGVWLKGWRLLQLVGLETHSERHAFAIVRAVDGGLEVWEFTRGDATDNGLSIEWGVESRSMNFQLSGRIKKLETFWFWMDRIRGDIEMSSWYRPDLNACWVPWGRWIDRGEACLPTPKQECRECKPPVFPTDRARDRVTMPQAPDLCSDGSMSREGFEFQLRLKIVGRGRLKKVTALAGALTESMFQALVCGTTKILPCEECGQPPICRDRIVLGVDDQTAIQFHIGLLEPDEP